MKLKKGDNNNINYLFMRSSLTNIICFYFSFTHYQYDAYFSFLHINNNMALI